MRHYDGTFFPCRITAAQPALGVSAASTRAFAGFGAANTFGFGAASPPDFAIGGTGAAASSLAFGAPAAAGNMPAFGASTPSFKAQAAPAALGFGASATGFGTPPTAQQVGAVAGLSTLSVHEPLGLVCSFVDASVLA